MLTFVGIRANISKQNQRHRRHSALLIRDADTRILVDCGADWLGHAPVRSQLDWCRAQSVTRAVFTHCGSQIVGGDEWLLGALVRHLGRERTEEPGLPMTAWS